MNIDMEQILSKLNCISRMAIIENAPNTEKMLIAFTKILKYRYQTENAMVIAETEIKLAEVLMEYYKTQTNHLIDFEYLDLEKSLSIVFVPHFSLLSFYYCMLNIFGNTENQDQMKIQTKVTVKNEKTQIDIVFKSNVDMETIYREAYTFVQDEYVSIKQAIVRIEAAFGAPEVSVHCNNSMMEVQIRI
ncbi:MAG: hypothetical protein WBI07_21725 [Mobilitalea sp.]